MNLKNLLIALLGILVTTTSYGQLLTQEHLFDIDGYDLTYFYTENGLKYLEIDEDNQTIKIYNDDYTLYKNVPKPNSLLSFDRASLPSDLLFNNDSKIEMILGCGSNLYLIDEEGTVLQNLGEGWKSECIQVEKNEYKLLIIKDIGKGAIIYSLPGKPNNPFNCCDNGDNSIILQSSLRSNSMAYPNPAKSTINLPYNLQPGETTTMNIFDLNGRLIESKTITSSFSMIKLNISDYTKGVYLYEYNGISSKFIVE